MADEVHLSVPYLSKFFVEYYGMNFLSYLNQYRLMHAVQELSTTDKNIDEIAIDSGFSSSHAFVSLFKKQYDMLPKEYRKEQKSNKENSHQQIEQHNYIAGLKKYLINDISSNVTTPTADRIIDFSVSGSTIHLINTWKKMMTVGRASDVLISDVQQMLTQLQLAVAGQLLGEPLKEAQIQLYGSFLATGEGHGTKKAIVAGLLGMKPDDYHVDVLCVLLLH